MEYKVVLTRTKSPTAFEKTMNEMANSGWRFHSANPITTYEKSGCGPNSQNVPVENFMLIFEKDDKTETKEQPQPSSYRPTAESSDKKKPGPSVITTEEKPKPTEPNPIESEPLPISSEKTSEPNSGLIESEQNEETQLEVDVEAPEKPKEDDSYQWPTPTNSRPITEEDPVGVGDFFVATDWIRSGEGTVPPGTLGKLTVVNAKAPEILFQNKVRARCSISLLRRVNVEGLLDESAPTEEKNESEGNEDGQEATWPKVLGPRPITADDPVHLGDFFTAKSDITIKDEEIPAGTLGRVTVFNPHEPEILFENGVRVRCPLSQLSRVKTS